MKEYMVYLNFITSLSYDKNVVLSKLGLSNADLDHKEMGHDIIWILESNLDRQLNLDTHIMSLLSLFSDREAMNDELFKNIYLDIGVFYDTATCSVGFQNDIIRNLTKIFPGLSIEITCYPSDES